MRVLITGGAGFIGHHVIEHLLKVTDWEIVSLDRLGVSGNLNRFPDMDLWEQFKHRVTFVHHDLRSPVNMFVGHAIGPVDYILHLGASTHVDRSIKDPMAFVLDNVVATTNVLQFARVVQDGLKAFLYFSTDEVFWPRAKRCGLQRGRPLQQR
jgi:dTDP-glucose 4,6-dehydratase